MTTTTDPLVVWKGTTAPALTARLINAITGAGEDLTGATVVAKLRVEGSSTVTTLGAGVLMDQTDPDTRGGMYRNWLNGTETATAGRYAYWFTVTYATGLVEDTDELVLLIEEHAPDPAPVGPPGAPCSPWITPADVAVMCPGLDEFDIAGDAIRAASEVMYALSGRQFNGICSSTVRPCSAGCACTFGDRDMYLPAGWGWSSGYGWGWMFARDCREPCGCGIVPTIRLAGFPVQAITQVKIDGVVVDPTKYRLDRLRFLLRIDGEAWPACQDLTAADSAVGSFVVTYTHGSAPPVIGKLAAAELACLLIKQGTGGDCQLPDGVTQVTRQGVTFSRQALQAAVSSGANAGMPFASAFLASYNPKGLRRRPLVVSPDSERYAWR